jgi:hypothetical protein
MALPSCEDSRGCTHRRHIVEINNGHAWISPIFIPLYIKSYAKKKGYVYTVQGEPMIREDRQLVTNETVEFEK